MSVGRIKNLFDSGMFVELEQIRVRLQHDPKASMEIANATAAVKARVKICPFQDY